MKVKFMKALTVLVLIVMGRCAFSENRLIGTVDFSGNARFNADSIANSSQGHWQWLSFPGGRLVLNPSPEVFHIPPPLATDIPLNLGGWVGSRIVKLFDISRVRVGVSMNELDPAMTLSTTWYPYKYAFDAGYAHNVRLHGQDFFLDADSSLIRDLIFTSGGAATVDLGGVLRSSEQARWVPSDRVLVVTATDYVYAMAFARVVNGRSTPLRAGASMKPNRFEVGADLESGTTEIAIGFGFATQSEGEVAAIARAKRCFQKTIPESLARSRAGIESDLRRVPAPQKWGVGESGGSGVSAAQHRRAYYAAWTFVVQDVVRKLPQTSFPYDQLMTGKSSLWNEGDPRAPGTAQWDSLLGYQWLCYVDCKAAWSAFSGLMSLVNSDGAIAGESLPARKAQTAWILYSRTHEGEWLRRLYPAIKKNLLWEYENPRWIYGSHNIQDEKDLEFTASWIYDAGFASKICSELGDSVDAQMWINKQAEMAENSQAWFFSDPTEIHQYFFANDKSYSRADRTDTDKEPFSAYITQALAVREFSPAVRNRLARYFAAGFRSHQSGMGYESYKYPDVNLTAYGLIDSGQTSQAVSFITGILQDTIRAGTFSEVTNKTPAAEGVQESLFSPLNIIEFTWLLNGCRCDSGDTVYLDIGGTSRH